MIELAGKKVVVLGLGVAGLATVRFLKEQGARIAVSEVREWEAFTEVERETLAGLDLETGGHSEDFVLAADFIVAGPGVPLDLPVLVAARRQGLPILGELALAAGRFSAPVIGVTGSNGKTTVTALIGVLLRAAGMRSFVGGNIGTPLLEGLMAGREYDAIVLELSSFQLELAGEFRPEVGLLLNLSPDHLDRHGSMERYSRAKMNLFACQRQDDLAIFGSDDPALTRLAATVRARSGTFGHRSGDQARIMESGIRLQQGKEEYWFDLTGTRLDSGVNRLNAAAALLGAAALVRSPGDMQAGLAEFQPAKHRMTPVATLAGIRFINDSKATNVGAMQAAIESCSGKVVLIAGGQAKGADFSPLVPLIAGKVRQILVMGEAAGQFRESFAGKMPVTEVADMEQAVRRGYVLARPGDTVLLAPGCASFDMFSDYSHRGRVFTETVLRLKKEMAEQMDLQQGVRA